MKNFWVGRLSSSSKFCLFLHFPSFIQLSPMVQRSCDLHHLLHLAHCSMSWLKCKLHSTRDHILRGCRNTHITPCFPFCTCECKCWRCSVNGGGDAAFCLAPRDIWVPDKVITSEGGSLSWYFGPTSIYLISCRYSALTYEHTKKLPRTSSVSAPPSYQNDKLRIASDTTLIRPQRSFYNCATQRQQNETNLEISLKGFISAVSLFTCPVWQLRTKNIGGLGFFITYASALKLSWSQWISNETIRSRR